MLDLMLMMMIMCGEGDNEYWLHNEGGVRCSNSRSEYYLQLSSNR